MATGTDLEAMYRLDVRCFKPPFRFSRSTMRRFATARDAFTLMLETDGVRTPELMGFVTVQVSRSHGLVSGYVVTLDVAPELRRQGIAGRLLAEAETEARRQDAIAMGLHVWTENLGAIRFYERAGYAPTQLHAGFYGADLDAYGYSKRLDAHPA